MVRRFRGEAHQKVDGKGRVSIPAHFRRVLEAGDPNWSDGKLPEFVIVYGDHRRDFLECYTMDAANDVDAKIDRMRRGSSKRRLLEKLFNGQSVLTTVDITGRIVLPAKLREKIGISSEAYFLATGDTFQIWKTQTYDEIDAVKTAALLNEMPEDFDVLTLLDDDEDEG